jgi:hypothetical protein
MREVVRRSSQVRTYQPGEAGPWEGAAGTVEG